jgi:hypothetical protein
MRELMVETAGAELAVRVSRPDGEALLLLHGGPRGAGFDADRHRSAAARILGHQL